jgi:hypothetical protein
MRPDESGRAGNDYALCCHVWIRIMVQVIG